MPSTQRWTWKLKFRIHLWCAYCSVCNNCVWRAWVWLLCDTHRPLAKLRCIFARKSRTCAYGNINSVDPLLILIVCQGILSQTKHRAIFWIPTVCHSRPQKEREMSFFSESNHSKLTSFGTRLIHNLVISIDSNSNSRSSQWKALLHFAC